MGLDKLLDHHHRQVNRKAWTDLHQFADALAEAGAGLEDVVRVRYIVPDPAHWPLCWPLVSKAFATARPAATMIAAALQASEMKIEIEVTARLPQSD